MNSKARILVVDDDTDILELLVSILPAHGYEVTGAASGAAALGLLRGGLPPYAASLSVGAASLLAGLVTLKCGALACNAP